MTAEIEDLLRKMARIIDSSEERHKRLANRYICLANRRLHKLLKKNSESIMEVAGVSTAIRFRWIVKFGIFQQYHKTITDRFND